MAILFKIEPFSKSKHSHMVDVEVFVYLRGLFFRDNEEFVPKSTIDRVVSVPLFFL